MAAVSSAAEAASASSPAPSPPSSTGIEEALPEAPLSCQALHATDGFCEILRIASDGGMLSAGWDGKLASMNSAEQPPSRAWMVSIAGKGGMLTAAAVSSDARWLALAQEYSNGFGVWVCPLDCKLGPSMDKLKLVARFTLPVRHLSWHASRSLLGIATDDGKLLTWDRETGKRRDYHTGSAGGSIRCLAFDPRGELLAAALASGALVIFGMEGGEERCRVIAWRKSVVASERLLMSWRPDGSMLALPGLPSVKLVARGSYATAEAQLEGGHRYATSLTAWSLDGSTLATASLEAVAFWRAPVLLKVGSVELGQPHLLLRVCRIIAAPYSIMWEGSNTLAIGTIVGSWVRLTTPNPIAEPVPASSQTSPAAEEIQGEASKSPAANPQVSVPEEVSQQQETAVPLQQAALQPGASMDQDLRRRFLAWNEHGTLKLIVNDASEQHEQGLRKSRAAAAGAGRLEVEYSRLRFRSAVREIRAPQRLVMGALGPGICAVATAPDTSGGQPAKIITHVATSKIGEKSCFELDLPLGEEVHALAVGKHFVAIATSNSNLRVHSIAGKPIDVQVLSGTPVCLVACEDLLLCIVNRCLPETETSPDGSILDHIATAASVSEGGLPAELNLEYALYGISAKKRLAVGRLPLSASAALRWCGFSADSLPVALDSTGALRALNRSGGDFLDEWLLAAELENAGKQLWPVHAEVGSLCCVELSKNSTEPRVGLVQKLCAVNFQPPARMDTSDDTAPFNTAPDTSDDAARREVEATVQRELDAASQREEEEYSQTLKLFEEAAKAGDEPEALDIIFRYFDDHTSRRALLLQQAHDLAVGLSQESLAQRLSLVLQAASGSAPPMEVNEEKEDAENQNDEQMQEESQLSLASRSAPSCLPSAVEPPRPAQLSLPVSASAVGIAAVDQDAAQRIAQNRAKALERRAAMLATRSEAGQASSDVARAKGEGLDPEVARRIAENRAKALERKEAAAAAKVTEKRPRSPSANVASGGEPSLLEAPSALRMRSC